MAAVVATEEWPRRSLTVAVSTPFSSSRLASSPDSSSPVTKVGSIILTGTRKPVAQNRQVCSQYSPPHPDGCFERHNEAALLRVFEPGQYSVVVALRFSAATDRSRRRPW